jgi:hypothetical protein
LLAVQPHPQARVVEHVVAGKWLCPLFSSSPVLHVPQSCTMGRGSSKQWGTKLAKSNGEQN